MENVMVCDCTTCIHIGTADGESCKRGTKAEVYCFGSGNYELWQGEGAEILTKSPEAGNTEPEKIDIPGMAKEKLGIGNAENDMLFAGPESPYMKMYSSPVEAVNGLASISKEEFEKNLGRQMSEAEQKEFTVITDSARYMKEKLDSGTINEEEMIKLFQDAEEARNAVEGRPVTEADGFNGVRKDGVIKSYACTGCKHHSIVGCFLGRYYDCVDNSRYLFEGITGAINPGEMGIEHKIEEEEADKAADFMDSILEERERNKQ